MKVNAAVARRPFLPFSIEELELDEPRPDEVIVRVVAVGICHTDIVFKDQETGLMLPAVLGHEGAGVVASVGSAISKVAPGDHVLVTFRSCGECDRCSFGHPAYCRSMPTMNYTGLRPDGSTTLYKGNEEVRGCFFGQSSFASHCLTYERNLVKVDSRSPLETYAPLGCGIQTGAGAVLRSFDCQANSTLLVLGAGTVGLSAVMAAAVRGCSSIVVVERKKERRSLAIELGATDAIDSENFVGSVQCLNPSGVDFALDTTGCPETIRLAIDCLGSRGQLGLVGVPPQSAATLELPIVPVIASGICVKGIIEGDSDPESFIPELIALHESGLFPFDKLITTYPFEKINDAIADQLLGKCVKPVLRLN